MSNLLISKSRIFWTMIFCLNFLIQKPWLLFSFNRLCFERMITFNYESVKTVWAWSMRCVWHCFLFGDFIAYYLSNPKQHIHSVWAKVTNVRKIPMSGCTIDPLERGDRIVTQIPKSNFGWIVFGSSSKYVVCVNFIF